jgi:hypothetical protein
LPEICRFFGKRDPHVRRARRTSPSPAFSCLLPGRAAIIAVDRIEVIAGGLPRKQQRLVEAWAEIHLDELSRDWALLQAGRPPIKIDPLR